MNWDLIFALVFYGLLFLFFITRREKFEVQWKVLALYKTRIGINLMGRISRIFPKFWEYLGYLGVFVGFAGMIFILFVIISGTYKLLFIPDTLPPLAPLLPGVQIPGLPKLTFWYWIVVIFILAVVHEFSHGLYSRLHGVRVKSSGFAFFGPILAAFVEPDENELGKKSKMKQLSVFAAGAFSNIVLAVVAFLIYALLLTPIAFSINESVGVEVAELKEGFPAYSSGMKIGEEIIAVNGIEVNDAISFVNSLGNLKPRDKIIIETDANNYGIEAVSHPNNKSSGYLGMSVKSINVPTEEVVNKYGNFLPRVFTWIYFLFFWLYVANLGVGLFNLLPLGPVDGGKMFYVGALAIFKNRKTAMKLLSYVSFFLFLLIVINLIPWISKLFLFLFELF